MVLNQLYRFTPLQTSFGVNMLALNGGRPVTMTLKDMHRRLHRVPRRGHPPPRPLTSWARRASAPTSWSAWPIAVANIDEMIALIRALPIRRPRARQLMARDWPPAMWSRCIELIDEPGRGVSPQGTYRLSDAQARAILELRLHRLTGLERDKIGADLREVADRIADYLEILASAHACCWRSCAPNCSR